MDLCFHSKGQSIFPVIVCSVSACTFEWIQNIRALWLLMYLWIDSMFMLTVGISWLKLGELFWWWAEMRHYAACTTNTRVRYSVFIFMWDSGQNKCLFTRRTRDFDLFVTSHAHHKQTWSACVYHYSKRLYKTCVNNYGTCNNNLIDSSVTWTCAYCMWLIFAITPPIGGQSLTTQGKLTQHWWLEKPPPLPSYYARHSHSSFVI